MQYYGWIDRLKPQDECREKDPSEHEVNGTCQINIVRRSKDDRATNERDAWSKLGSGAEKQSTLKK
jgi:hypothetical protein